MPLSCCPIAPTRSTLRLTINSDYSTFNVETWLAGFCMIRGIARSSILVCNARSGSVILDLDGDLSDMDKLQSDFNTNSNVGVPNIMAVSSARSTSSSGPDTGMIVGIVVGVVLLVAIIVVVSIVLYKNRYRFGSNKAHPDVNYYPLR